MVSIQRPLSYNPTSAARNNFTQQTSHTQPPKNEKTLAVELTAASGSLKRYVQYAGEDENSNKLVIKRDNLSYSTLKALSQYNGNANFDRIESTYSVFGLSVYA